MDLAVNTQFLLQSVVNMSSVNIMMTIKATKCNQRQVPRLFIISFLLYSII